VAQGQVLANAAQLKPIKEWVIQFERFWVDRLDHLEGYLNEIQFKEENDD